MKTMEKTRHAVEHKLLPQMLHDSGPMLLYNVLGDPKKVLLQLFSQAGLSGSELNEVSYSDSFRETHVVRHRENDSVLIIQIQMPTATEVSDCRAIYLCYSGQTAFNMLFTSELRSDGQFCLCGCDADFARLNFGVSPESLEEEMENVSLFFWEMMKNDGTNTIKTIRSREEQSKSICAS